MATGMVLVIVDAQYRPFRRIHSRLRWGCSWACCRRKSCRQIIGFNQSGNLDHHAAGRHSCLARLIGGIPRRTSSPILNVPSFIVTLGGLLVWRGATWFVTQRPHRCAAWTSDLHASSMGGGTEGSIGSHLASWIVRCRRLPASPLYSRRSVNSRKSAQAASAFRRRPVWAEYFQRDRALGCRAGHRRRGSSPTSYPVLPRDQYRAQICRCATAGICLAGRRLSQIPHGIAIPVVCVAVDRRHRR